MTSAVPRRSVEERHSIWTHPSVLLLAEAAGTSPINAVATKGRETVFKAIQSGWSGPPYDPFALAEFLKIAVEPRQDVVDARTLPAGEGRFRIEFNPNRSAARINFSIAHEIAHTLFPDCSQAIRNRFTHAEMKPNAEEQWISNEGRWRVECLGIAPYPGHLYPRVVGIVTPTNPATVQTAAIQYLKGDATAPRGTGARMIVQVVNDKAITWGKGFSVAVRTRWPHAQKDFTRWVFASRPEFKLGNIHIARLDESIELASMVAQHGYGPSLFPRIQYLALEECLSKVAVRAKETNASIHMPRIGCGEAGGEWKIVSEIIDETLSRENIPVTVYDLPVIRSK